jgi:hypothetical protein
MEKVELHNCKLGRRVMLESLDPTSSFCIGDTNPKMGTKYECAGTIRFFKRTVYRTTGIIIGVDWDNGRSNYYMENELVYCDGYENKAVPIGDAVCVSIW